MNTEYMNMALELSEKGKGYVNPNPLVGAVIVKNGKVIGQGYHEKFGENHAEINAINSATESVEGSTMYVTLEPCSHHGKTPPCCEAIVKNKIKKVVVAMLDPNPLVAGRGIEYLRLNRVNVETKVLEKEAMLINEKFIKYITTNRPFVLMKTAMTLDGKIASSTGNSKWISCEKSRALVHEMRHEYSGIMVGIGTVLADNPTLTTRREGKDGSHPHKIIVDSMLNIPLDTNIIKDANNRNENDIKEVKTIIATTQYAAEKKVKELTRLGVTIIKTPAKEGRVDMTYLIDELGKIGIDSVLLEGGSNLNFSMIEEKLVDKVMTFIAPKIVGGNNSKTSVGGTGFKNMSDASELDDVEVTRIDCDILVSGYLKG